ncbi:nuclear transport factor 2 family protein [Leptolyngbya sp. FACHB-36]|uniref:nuclear transport factor 2 family protein n=1 Tax=Leptolyngbya sp. FACHB-36 TaxID=2692808 RepID=UPI00168179B7|nr:nuclear transport factor 2 family protein [Leptolyngbya sp. FACHB-36]MBD2019768.1 nuclear transport factor 2 family protein [Leptolyngbya sp. FACHB-36]
MTNLEIIQELYRAFREKDYDTFLHICTPDLEWIQNEGFPQGATYQGAASVVEGVFKFNDERWEKFSFRIDRYLDAGNSVIVIGAYVGCDRQTQKSFCAAAAHVYDLIDSKVCRFRMFADTKTIWDTMV